MTALRLTLAGSALLLSGCASGFAGLRPLTYQEPGETRLYVSYSRCPNAPGENIAPFLSALLLGTASKALEGFGTALAKGAEGGALPSSIAAGNTEIGKNLPQCVIAIRGDFKPDKDGEAATVLPGKASIAQLDIKAIDGTSRLVTLPPVYDLQHYVELQLLVSKNKGAMTFAPVTTQIARSMDGSKDGSRELSIALKFESPGKDETGSAVLIGSHTVGKARTYEPSFPPATKMTNETPPREVPDTSVPPARPQFEAPWFASPTQGVDPAAASAGGAGGVSGGAPNLPVGTPGAFAPAANTGSSDDEANAGKPSGPIPYTVTATIVETRPTKEFLAFAASVFSATTPAIEEELKKRIDPATISTAKNAALDAKGDYAEALGAAQAARLSYCALPVETSAADLFTKSGEARKAQIGANKAAIAADINPPFTAARLINVSGGAPLTANAVPCS